ncbi:MAG TPA: response regulator [Pyrinomonadaceae bacterium]|nr:response regulator [Pyrinomonadaceae bacterium]
MSDTMSAASGRTIMVVDDVEDIRSLLHLWLEKHGYRVVEAGSGPEAVETAERERPDLILMDVSMPGGDGLNATVQIRKHAQLSDVPVVVISANGTEYYRDAALTAGCNEYLVKPIDPVQLETIMSRLLSKSRSEPPRH